MKQYATIAFLIFLLPPLCGQTDLPTVPLWFNRLEESLLNGEVDSVLTACDELLRSTTDLERRGELFYLKGKAYLADYQPDKAEGQFREALGLFREKLSTRNLALTFEKFGDVAFQTGDVERASVYYDSALIVAEQLSDPTMHSAVLRNAALFYSSIDRHDKSMELLKQSLQLNEQTDERAVAFELYNQIATNYYSLGELDSAILYFEKLIALKERSEAPLLLSSDQNTLGTLYLEKGDYPSAQNYLIEALKGAEASRDTFLLMSLLGSTSKVYGAQKMWRESLAYSDRAIQLARNKGVTYVVSENLKNQGDVFLQMDSLERGLSRYQSALKIQETLGNSIKAADLLIEIGKLHQKELNGNEARIHLERALELRKGSEDFLGVLKAKLLLSELEMQAGNVTIAIAHAEESLSLSEKSNHQQGKSKAFYILSGAHSQLGNFQEAYHFFRQYHELNDSLLSNDRMQAMNELALLYETEKKDRAYLQQQADLKIQENKVQQRNLQMLILLFVLFLLLISVFFLYYLNRKNKQLNAQKIEVLKRNQQTQRLTSFIEGEERERRRIAKDLHDGLGAQLATAKMRINALEYEIPKLKNLPVYHRVQDLIDESCRNIREISHNMLPDVVEQHGLQSALRGLCQSTGEAHNIQVNFISFGLDKNLDNDLKISLYRIVQELLRNIVKHARAKEAIVQLIGEPGIVHLTVEDDGVGFEYDLAISGDGIGLKSILSRVEYHEGTTNCISRVNEGTSFAIDIPV